MSGEPVTAEDVEYYADYIGNPRFPIFADAGGETLSAATPMTAEQYPELCIISPDMELIDCVAGHEQLDHSFSVIREHAGSR